MRMWCAKPVGATHHGRLHNAQATEWREGLDRPGRGHPDLAGIYQPGNMTIDARKKKKKKMLRRTVPSHSSFRLMLRTEDSGLSSYHRADSRLHCCETVAPSLCPIDRPPKQKVVTLTFSSKYRLFCLNLIDSTNTSTNDTS